MDDENVRDPEEAKDDIRSKLEEGEEPSADERQFLEGERVEVESDRGPTGSELTG